MIPTYPWDIQAFLSNDGIRARKCVTQDPTNTFPKTGYNLLDRGLDFLHHHNHPQNSTAMKRSAEKQLSKDEADVDSKVLVSPQPDRHKYQMLIISIGRT